MSAYRDGDVTVVLLPAQMGKAEERRWVQHMLARLEAREQRSAAKGGDAALLARARRLSEAYLGGVAQPSRVRWVSNQRSRWGSCTPDDRSIRLSTRLQRMPPWVIDYVLVHELAHLREPDHGAAFWSLVAAYPKAERARGYLEGVAAAAGLTLGDVCGAGEADDVQADPAEADADDESASEERSVAADDGLAESGGMGL